MDADKAQELVEQRIRQAMQGGEFDDLPGSGRPLEILKERYDPAWWARRWLNNDRLQQVSLESVRQLERRLARLWLLDDEDSVRVEVAELNEILASAGESLDRDLSPLDEQDVLSTWRQLGSLRPPR